MKTKLVNQIQKAGDMLQYSISLVALIIVLITDKSLLTIWGGVVVATFVAAHALKRMFNNTKLGERPNGGENSFPSGHTAGAFAGAAFIHFMLALPIPWVILAYALAALTGYSRIISRNHWPRDVIAGAMVAIATTYTINMIFVV
jgi:membrane-associated phospholipid phosphatase